MFKSLFLPIIAVAGFITIVGLMSQGKFNSILKNQTLTPSSNLKTIIIEGKEIKVEVAKTNEERSKGLSNRDSLDKDSGMIFIFDRNSKPTFWMKDTKIPLDIIWIKNDKVVGINKEVKPEIGVSDNNLKKYPAPEGIDYVLEVNSGFSDENSIKVGSSAQKLSDL